MRLFAEPGSFPASKQFFMSREPVETPEGWSSRKVSGFHVVHSPDLPVAEGTYGGRHGLILGWPLFPGAEATGEMGGRWVFISEGLLELDPLGSYSVVYSPDLGVVASTTALIDSAALVPDEPLNIGLGLPRRANFYPFGLTPYTNVRRLLPNHVLNVDGLATSRSTSRSASRSTSANEELTDETAVRRIGDNIRASVEAIAARYPIILGGTAGNETRVMLAAMRTVSDVEMFTIGHAELQDTITAAYLAKKLGYPHSVWPRTRDEAITSAWFHAVGECVAGQSLANAPVKANLPADKAFLKGMGGEIGRAYYYREGDSADMRVDASSILGRMHLPVTPEILAAAEPWLAGAPAVDTFDLLDLLYLENRVGAWASPQLHGDLSPAATFFPFNQASTIAALRALSHEVKRADRMGTLVVNYLAPGLGHVPFNAPFGLRAWSQKMVSLSRRAVEKAGRAFR